MEEIKIMGLVSIFFWSLVLPLIILVVLFGVLFHYLDGTVVSKTNINCVELLNNTAQDNTTDPYISMYDCSCCHPYYISDPNNYHSFDTGHNKA